MAARMNDSEFLAIQTLLFFTDLPMEEIAFYINRDKATISRVNNAHCLADMREKQTKRNRKYLNSEKTVLQDILRRVKNLEHLSSR